MAELTTNATGDTWHEAAQAAVDEAAELLGQIDVLRVDIEAVFGALRFCDPAPQVTGCRATVTSRPRGDRGD